MTDKPATIPWPAVPDGAGMHLGGSPLTLPYPTLVESLTVWVRANLPPEAIRGGHAAQQILATYTGPAHDPVTFPISHDFREACEYQRTPDDPASWLVQGILRAGYSQGARDVLPRAIEAEAKLARSREEVCVLQAEVAALKAKLKVKP